MVFLLYNTTKKERKKERKKEKNLHIKSCGSGSSLVCNQSDPGPNRPACEADLDGLKFWIEKFATIYVTQYRFTVPHKISERYCTSERNHFKKEIARGR